MKTMTPQIIQHTSNSLLPEIEQFIEQKGRHLTQYLNTEISRLYWSIGNYIITKVEYQTYSQYGQQIISTLSQQLTEKF